MALIDLLPSNARLTSLPAGEVIFAQGDKGTGVATKGCSDPVEGKVVETDGPGELGEMLIDASRAVPQRYGAHVLVPHRRAGFVDLVTRVQVHAVAGAHAPVAHNEHRAFRCEAAEPFAELGLVPPAGADLSRPLRSARLLETIGGYLASCAV